LDTCDELKSYDVKYRMQMYFAKSKSTYIFGLHLKVSKCRPT